jgi:hypothetical protein
MKNNLSESQKKKDLESKPKKSQKKIEVEDPSQIAQHLNDKQMRIFLEALINKK